MKEIITQIAVYVANYKMIEIDLSKQQALDADPKAIRLINFTWSLEWRRKTAMYFIIPKEKETVLDFQQGTVTVL